jgi:hypothetical protein
MKDSGNLRDPVIRQVGEFHHRELNNFVPRGIKTGCFYVQHDSVLVVWPWLGAKSVRRTNLRSTR